MHRLLARQLRKLGLDATQPPDAITWRQLLHAIGDAYEQSDQDRYTLERSLALSSDEMNALYLKQKTSYEARLRTIFDSITDLIWLKDIHGKYLACNSAFEKLIGMDEAQIIGKIDAELPNGPLSATLQACGLQVPESIQSCIQINLVVPGPELRIVDLEIMMTPVLDPASNVIANLGVGRDVTLRKRADERIRELAFFDQLTSLPNRTLLHDRINQTLTAAARNGSYTALLFIDLDHFKMLNDTLGHDTGDLLLQKVAKRLQTCVRESDTVARLGGDEFVVLLTNLDANLTDAGAQVESVGANILEILGQPYLLGKHVHTNTPSIGATLCQGHQTSLEMLLKQADLAMYKSKEAGRNAIRFFDPTMESAIRQRMDLELEFRHAIANNELVVHYQAQVDGSGRLVGAEALVRWLHPQRGLVPPGDFIPFAEETGLILPMGKWVLARACEQLAAWSTRPWLADLTISVNVSAHQFRQFDFLEMVEKAISESGANPAKLKLELTESLLVSNVEEVIQKMHLLKDQGVGCSLDDFGTGYSSLSYLKRMPLEQLKIDQSFVRDMLTDANDASIVKAIIDLARNLGKSVIAEGVESEQQRNFLTSAGCHFFQGYWIARPKPIDKFEAFFKLKLAHR